MPVPNPMPTPWRDVTVVVVAYNSGHAIGGCLQALGAAAKVVVVDNASSDDSVAAVRAALPGADILRNAENVGFGTAVNQGFARAATKYALLLSPDTTIDGAALAKLIGAAEANPEAAIAAPLLKDSAGRTELSVMGPGEHNHRPADFVPDGDFCTWFAMAAVWLCPLDRWRAVGGFDEKIFLYGEDADLCLRTTKAGFSIVVVPDAVALHLGGQSSRKNWKSRWVRDWHMTWGHLYLEQNHGDAAKAASEARSLLRRHGGRAILYFLLLRWGRAMGNLAKASAARAFLGGKAAHSPGRQAAG